MENFECPICIERYIEPIECLYCNNNFCKKHIKGFNNVCPLCKKSPFKFRENIWLSRTISNIDFSYKCSLCGFESNQTLFWSHLIEEHKNDIINHFNQKIDENEKEKDKNICENNINKNINQDINKDINDFSNDKNKNQIKNPDFKRINQDINISNIDNPSILNSHRVNYANNNPMDNIRINKKNSKEIEYSKNSNPPLSERNKNKFYYCNKEQNSILCKCCPDHICKEGNCFCVKCMKYNINKLNLKKGELINKSGNIAKLFKGSYYCGIAYETIIENVLGMKFKKLTKCQYPLENCDDCKVITQFKDKYLN